MKNNKLIALLTTLIVVSGCGSKTPSSSNTSSSSTLKTSSTLASSSKEETSSSSSSLVTSSSSSSSEVTSSSSSEEESYVIVVNKTNGVEVVLSTDRAKKGEVVTFRCVTQPGYTVLNAYYNNVKCQVEGDTYSFVMPDTSVRITLEVSVEGDVILAGEISQVLVNEGGIYVARNVRVERDSYVKYVVTTNGVKEELSITKINNEKSFAAIDTNTDSSRKNGFMIAGNAVYDFYYDPSNAELPCYVQRVEVINVPETPNQFTDLFEGQAKSSTTMYPAGVNHVDFKNHVLDIDYSWDLYADNSSLATVKKVSDGSNIGNVYKQVNGNVYEVVDNYLEAREGNYPTRDDSIARSSKFEIVNDVTHRHYQRTNNQAVNDASVYSHNMESLYFEFHEGYRSGFEAEYNELLKDYAIDFTTNRNEDGSFHITIDSYKVEVSDQDAASAKYTTYKIDIDFTKAGAIKSGTYVEKAYDKSEFNFSGEYGFTVENPVGKTIENIEFSYTYGASKGVKASVDFDKTPYFASSLTNVTFSNKAVNTLNQHDALANYLSFDTVPSTALDGWQYGAISSSNLDVIAPISENDEYNFVASGLGSSTIRVANHTTNDVYKDVVVNVENNTPVRSYWMHSVNFEDPDNILSNQAVISAGKVTTVDVCPSPYAATSPFTISSSNESLLKVTVGELDPNDTYYHGRFVYLDATGAANIKENTKVILTVNSDNYDPYYSPTKFTITITPQTSGDFSLVGTWTHDANCKLIFTDTVYSEDSTYNVGRIEVDGTTFNFKYRLDPNGFAIKASIIGQNSIFYTLQMIYEIESGEIGVILFYDGYDGSEDILGYLVTDDFGDEIEKQYVFFSK